jgi:putative RNA 2'-phosphotransferase
MNHIQTSKKLSWLLRHGAKETGLAMDASGWAAISDVLRITRLRRADLDAAVADNNKQRFEVDGERIRATQGHSQGNAPIDLDTLERSWERLRGRTEPIFHGTRLELVETIRGEGLRAMSRTHVHLADAPDATVGKRANVDVLLEIDPTALEAAGIGLFRSPNGVLLARTVPPEAIVGVRPVTRRARAALGA